MPNGAADGAVKVEPLPAETTDTLEAGWSYVDQAKIVVYGAIDPIPTVLERLASLEKAAREAE